MRLPERLLRAMEVAHSQAELPELVEPVRRHVGCEVGELRTREANFLLRVEPVAAQAHDLCAVDTALARKTGDGLPLAPALCSVRPVAGPDIVADVAAGRDHPAVDDRRGIRVELAAHRRDRRLVQERESLVQPALLHERVALVVQAERDQVAVAERPAQLHRPLGVLRRRIKVPSTERTMRPGAFEIPVIGRLRSLVEETLGTLHPGLGQGGRAPELVVARDPQREPRGAS
jgi:hypothetical protein